MTPMIIWAVKGSVLFVLLIITSYHDIKTRQIPDIYSMMLALLAICVPHYENLWGVFCCLPFLIAAISMGGIGGADIKISGCCRYGNWSYPGNICNDNRAFGYDSVSPRKKSAFGEDAVETVISTNSVFIGRYHQHVFAADALKL